ncbi:MAG TPA: zinc-ribbon domain-containing protein [Sphingomicrobium sp.]|nr:zinc-ribbon domain-containing protein [Sphingomicrobium sp.]
MILTCPACGTQYVVKDGAIPPGGRQVRCAGCKHSWHQDPEIEEPQADAGPQASEPAEPPPPFPPPEDGAVPAPAEEEPLPGVPDIQWRIDPAPAAVPDEQVEEAEYEPIAEPHGHDADAGETTRSAVLEPDEAPSWQPPVGGEDESFSPFAYGEEEEEPRRRWPAVLLGLLLIGALAAAFWFLAPPQWKQRLGIGTAADTPLQLMMTHSDRQKLASGNELLAVSGRVINPTDERQDVPPIQAQLRSRDGDLVYSWTIAPPARTLPPRASATFNSAEVNVPSGGDELTITLGNPKT